MELTFLSPLGALLAVAIVLTLGALAITERRARRVRAALRLSPPSRAATAALAASLAAVPALIGLAAAQPVIERTSAVYSRTGAEVFVVVDTSRSMLAASSAHGKTRFDRARQEAAAVRASLPDVPFGLASLTNRLLPHLFPTTDEPTFAATLERSIGIERPPPDRVNRPEVTTFKPLGALDLENFYSGQARRRVAVVFTDGETADPGPNASLADQLRRQPPVRVLFVHVWQSGERVFGPNGLREPQYRSDPASGATLRELAAAVDGQAFEESNLGAAEAALRRDVGAGRRVRVATRRRSYALAPWVVLAAIVPLGFVVGRRNV